MEQNTTSNNSAVSESDLRNAGASEKYISYYMTAMDMGISTPSTNHAEKVVNRGIEYSGGSFHDSLWNDEPRFSHGNNPYGADTQNHDILREAGIYQEIPA
jgi:Iap family predicted aminopeptidase